MHVIDSMWSFVTLIIDFCVWFLLADKHCLIVKFIGDNQTRNCYEEQTYNTLRVFTSKLQPADWASVPRGHMIRTSTCYTIFARLASRDIRAQFKCICLCEWQDLGFFVKHLKHLNLLGGKPVNLVIKAYWQITVEYDHLTVVLYNILTKNCTNSIYRNDNRSFSLWS